MKGNTRQLIEASLNDDFDEFDQPEFQPLKKRNDPPPKDDRRQQQKAWGKAIARSNRERLKAEQGQ